MRTLLCSFLLLLAGCGNNSTKFAVVIASYNNEKYVEANLKSVFNQSYNNFYVVYINDASKDGTYAKAKELLEDWSGDYTLINNAENKGACANYYNAIHNHVADDDVVVVLDGDDMLSGPKTLHRLKKAYANEDVWLTYGQFRNLNSQEKGFCASMPEKVVRNCAFRDYVHIPSHLKTYKAWLFKQIKKEHLMYEGKFLEMSWDVASMMPMMEMARDHFKFMHKVLYTYNDDNPISDHQISQQKQRQLDLYIRSLPRYTPLKSCP